MQNSVLTLVRDAGRMLLYSLVLFPALMMYAIALLMVQDGSPSGQFLRAARDLVEDAPAGKVMRCVSAEPSRYVVSVAPYTETPVSPKADEPMRPTPSPLCRMEPVDSDFWTRPMDQLLTILWLAAALLGASYAFMTQCWRRSQHDYHDMLSPQKKD